MKRNLRMRHLIIKRNQDQHLNWIKTNNYLLRKRSKYSKTVRLFTKVFLGWRWQCNGRSWIYNRRWSSTVWCSPKHSSFPGEGREQLTAADVKESQTIASVRIHVKRAIQRCKSFKILRNEIPLTLHASVNQIWTVCCLLCNFMPPLIQEVENE